MNTTTRKARTKKQVANDLQNIATIHSTAILENYVYHYDFIHNWAADIDRAHPDTRIIQDTLRNESVKAAIKQGKKDAKIVVLGSSEKSTMTFYIFQFDPADLGDNMHNGAIDIKVRYESINAYGVHKGRLGTVRYNLTAQKFAAYENFGLEHFDSANKALAKAVKHILMNRVGWSDIVVPTKTKPLGNKFYQWILKLNPNYATGAARKIAQETQAANLPTE